MGDVRVAIKDSHVYWTHDGTHGHVSTNYDLNTLALTPANAVYLANSVVLTKDAFVRFKNGGKRLDSTTAGKTIGKTPINRERDNRTKDDVEMGDVGTYSTGPNSLKPNVADPGLQRDHINSFASMEYRTNTLGQGPFVGMGYSNGQIKARGLTIAIDHDTHVDGWTYGGKQKRVVPNTGGQTRMEFAASNPAEAFYFEVSKALKSLYTNGGLTYEIVGSYRHLYNLSVKTMGLVPTDDLDGLIEAYLRVAQ